MTNRKGERVWVAVDCIGPLLGTINPLRRQTVEDLSYLTDDAKRDGITIRRATLTLDPVKPKRRAK